MNFRFNFWEWLWLSDIRDKQDRTNDLLEQIRYLQLTPAQRAAEEAKKAELARERNKTICLLGVIMLAGIGRVLYAAASQHPATPVQTQYSARAGAATPAATPESTPMPGQLTPWTAEDRQGS